MEARLLGPAKSPGRAIYEQELERLSNHQQRNVGSSESTLLSSIRSIFPSYNSSTTNTLEFRSRVTPLPLPYNATFSAIDSFQNQIDEELAWFGSKLVWSRGSTVYRTFSYHQEKQKVTNALFARFTLEAEPDTQSKLGTDQETEKGPGQSSSGLTDEAASEIPSWQQTEGPQTYGPFHTSQHAKWGRPDRRAGRDKSMKRPQAQQRCLVVLLDDWIHVYYPSGHDLVVALPFPVDEVWAVPSGGIVLQRKLNAGDLQRSNSAKNRDLGPVNIARGMDLDATMELVLEELEMDRLEDVLGNKGSEEGRLYTLMHPSSELQMVCKIDGVDQKQRTDSYTGIPITHPGRIEALDPEKELLWLTDDADMPLAVFCDHKTEEIVFSRWTRYRNEQGPEVSDGPGTKQVLDSATTTEQVDVPVKRIESQQRPGLGRIESASGSVAEKRSSVGGTRSLSRAHNRRVSFKPETINPPMETGNPDPLATLEGDTANSARIKADADLIRGLPHQRRVSQGMKEANKKTKLALEDLDVGETTMLFGIDQPKDRSQPDMLMTEIQRWSIPNTSTSLGKVKVFASDRLGANSVHLNVHVASTTQSLLYIFRLERPSSDELAWKTVEVAKYTADAAVPIICTRARIHDVLIVADGDARIITSHGRFAPVDLSTVEAYTATSVVYSNKRFPTSEDTSIRNLSNPVSSRVTATLHDGSETLLDLNFTSSNVDVNQILQALGQVLPRDPMMTFKLNVLAHLRSPQADHRGMLCSVGDAILSSLGFQDKPEVAPKSPWARLRDRANRDPRADLRATNADRTPRSAVANGHDCAPFGRTSSRFALPVLQALHAVAQEYLLRTSQREKLLQLVPTILTLAIYLNLSTWVDYWQRQLPTAAEVDLASPSSPPDIVPSYLLEPADVLEMLGKMMVTRQFSVPKQLVLRHTDPDVPSREFGHSESLPHLTFVLCLYRTFATKSIDPEVADRVLRTMVLHGVTVDWINDLPWSIALPLWDTIRMGRKAPSMTWPLQVYTLIDRLDIAAQLDLGHRSVATQRSIPHQGAFQQGTFDYDAILSQITPRPSSATGLDVLQAKHKSRKLSVSNMRFPNDRRLWDVESLLQTTQSRPVKPDDKPHLSEEERLVQHQTLVHSLGYRTISQVIGYGLFILDSKEPSNTDRFEIPSINVGVQLLPSTTTIFPEFKVESLTWPAFHQGVAAGLSIKRNSDIVNSSWIFYNRPEQPTPAFGGFLFGLGLTGHLKNLETWHLYPNLAQRHDHISVGLLLGMAATYAGSQDRRLTTMLSAGVSALLPPGSANLNTSPILQSASLFGLGLVHLASGSHRLAEISLTEIGRYDLPGLDEQGEYKELYAFSSACAFGLIMLGQGGRNREHDTHCVNRLRGYFVDLHLPENEIQDPSLGTHRDVNTTAAGAVLSLGLMYLRTNQVGIANLLLPPQNAFELDHIRPDMLIVRTLSYNLIMWDEIRPTQTWLNAQFPDFVLAAWNLKSSTGTIDEISELAYFHITAGACFALGLKFAGTMNKDAQQVVATAFDLFIQQMGPSTTSYETKIKRIALRQGFALLLIALALVVSGSGDVHVYRRLRSLHGVDGHPYSTRTALHTAIGIIHVGAGRYSFGRSNLAIAAMAIAFFPRYPHAMDDNRSYLQAWRHLWAIAVEPRCVATADLDTLRTVVMPMISTNRSRDGKLDQKLANSPYLADAFERTVLLTGGSPRYTSPIINVEGSPLQREVLLRLQTVFVKRKSNNLDYSEDPKGNRSISILANAAQIAHGDLQYSLTGSTYRPGELDNIETIVAEFTDDAMYRGFLSAFGSPGKTEVKPRNSFSWTETCKTIVLDSMLQNQPEVLNLNLGLLSGLGVHDSQFGPLNLKLLDIALEYYGSTQTDRSRSASTPRSLKMPPLMRRSTLVAVFTNERRVIRQNTGSNYDSETRYLQAVRGEAEGTVTPELGVDLVSHRVPNLARLRDLRGNIEAIDRRATAAAASQKDRNVIARSALLKMAYVDPLAQRQNETTSPTPLETWTERSLTNALREWCQ